MADANDVARLVHLNGGRLVGKTRLQKSAYFLDAKNVGFGFDFSYHRFGPYSEDLAIATDDADTLDLLNVEWKESQGGAKFAIFCATSRNYSDEAEDKTRREILETLKNYSSIEVELAATANFLRRNGFAADPWTETQRRKATKVNPMRLERSKKLLSELSL